MTYFSGIRRLIQTSEHPVNEAALSTMKKHVSPVRILWTDVHLQQDSLREGFEALPTLPQVPVTELAAQLAGGRRASQDSLVFRGQLAEGGVRLRPVTDLIQQGETPRAGGVRENHGAHEGGGRGGRR